VLGYDEGDEFGEETMNPILLLIFAPLKGTTPSSSGFLPKIFGFSLRDFRLLPELLVVFLLKIH